LLLWCVVCDRERGAPDLRALHGDDAAGGVGRQHAGQHTVEGRVHLLRHLPGEGGGGEGGVAGGGGREMRGGAEVRRGEGGRRWRDTLWGA